MTVDSHGTCFVSHRYADKQTLARCLVRRLPGGLAPFIFEPVPESPDYAVTDILMGHIRRCDALVYLDSALSLDSFWVGFERNYAARMGKPVYAFRPERRWFAFARDHTMPVDPITSILFNLQIEPDLARIKLIGAEIWDGHRVDFRGVQWRRLDNEPRQLLDSVDDMNAKLAHGGIVLLFLSNDFICAGFHDYADPFTFQRAKKDFDSPVGATAHRFAALPPERVQVVWLEPPDRARIEATLDRLDPAVWQSFVRVVRAALQEKSKCIAFLPSGAPVRNAIDSVLVRAFWLAKQADPVLSAAFRARFDERPRAATATYSTHTTELRDRVGRA